MVVAERESGIGLVNRVPWGTHFGLFYRTKQDLADILVPYFIAGLKNGEFCTWVTAEPLDAEEAKACLAKALPDIETYLDRGQIEIIPYTEFYVVDGVFDPERVLAGWAKKLRKARERGFNGMRVTGNTSWLGPGNWKEFIAYERKVSDVIGRYEMLAICSYPLEKCDGNDILDVVGTHQFALTRREGEWKLIEDQGRKKARKALRESERFIDSVFEGIQEGICILDRDMNIVRANYAMEKKYSDRLPLAGKKCHQAIRGCARPCEGCPSVRAISEKTKQMSTMAYTDARGAAGWIELYAFPMLDDQGNVSGVIEHGRDITQRKRAEDDVRESKSRLEAILASMNDGLLIVDAGGKVTLFNDAVARFYRFPGRDEFITNHGVFIKAIEACTPDGELLPVADWPFSRALRGEVVSHYELLIKRRDTGETWLGDYSAAPIRDKNGNITSVVITMRDVTGRKRAEEELMAAKQQAELYLDLMGHDINNLHQVAMGYLELAQDMPPGEVQAEFLEKPMEVLRRSAQLIQNVRKLQKLQDGAFPTRNVDVRAMLTDVRRECGAVPQKRIVMDLNGHEHCPVLASELLHDVFANLVSNAIKHTGDGTDIIVALDIVEDSGIRHCRVAVEDNGPGIPDKFKANIFNRTLQGTNKARGMGLGLYLVKSLVESYHGKVWVEDRVKGDHTQGARFVVLLPVADER